MASQAVKSVEFDDTSDPLDFQTPGSVLSLSLTNIRQSFTVTTDSYISLCSRVYAACCVELPGFANEIPESAFQYYAVIRLWKRFAQILPNFTINGSEFFNEIRLLKCEWHVPSPLRTYVKGIGHFRDPHHSDRQFILPVLPMCEKVAGIPYTFGRVNAKTHFFYEAFPAPGIAALRMLADINYTRESSEKNLLWDLPKELQPDVVESQIESNRPTKNLLGWAPAQRLTDGQLELFKTLKIDDNFEQKNYSSSCDSINSLYSTISGYFTEESNGLRYGGRGGSIAWSTELGPLPSTGSLVQGMAIERRNEFFKFDRSAMYCEGNISVCSPYKLNDKLTKGAAISGYRMAKEPIGNRHCWSCYDFNEYKSVPESWIRSRNTIYTYGSSGSNLNQQVYATAYISKRSLQNECILHALRPMKNWNIYM